MIIKKKITITIEASECRPTPDCVLETNLKTVVADAVVSTYSTHYNLTNIKNIDIHDDKE